MTVINPAYGNTAARNGFDAKTLGYSYSGLYTMIDPKRFNIKNIIDDDNTKNYNNLHEKVPVNKYMIYGLSSFQLKDGSGCSSFSVDVSVDSVNSYTFSTNQATYLENVVFQADIYFPQTVAVCSPGV
jgi:uncharacterized membrane protein YcgQ (UPF0703/DUF1980 family)